MHLPTNQARNLIISETEDEFLYSKFYDGLDRKVINVPWKPGQDILLSALCKETDGPFIINPFRRGNGGNVNFLS